MTESSRAPKKPAAKKAAKTTTKTAVAKSAPVKTAAKTAVKTTKKVTSAPATTAVTAAAETAAAPANRSSKQQTAVVPEQLLLVAAATDLPTVHPMDRVEETQRAKQADVLNETPQRDGQIAQAPQVAQAEVVRTTDAVQVEPAAVDDEEEDPTDHLIQEARVWQDDGWTARVMKNEDDDGWAVAMTLDGEPEPALVGPWTMGRDKKNPKPLDANAFSVLVKTAFEVRRRHEQQLHAMLHKSLTVDSTEGRMKISLQIVPDEYEPHAFLRAHDDFGDLVAEVKVEAHFKLNNASANRWIDNAFRRPGD